MRVGFVSFHLTPQNQMKTLTSACIHHLDVPSTLSYVRAYFPCRGALTLAVLGGFI